MNHLAARVSIFLASLAFALFLAVPVFAQSAGATEKCTGSALQCAASRLNIFASGSGVSTTRTPQSIVGRFINTAVAILGVVAVALIVYAGGLWITAGGDDEKVSQAKKIIKNVVIGMIVLGLAYAITSFIVSLIA